MFFVDVVLIYSIAIVFWLIVVVGVSYICRIQFVLFVFWGGPMFFVKAHWISPKMV